MKKKYLIIILIAFVLSITGCSKSSSNIENYLNSGTTIDTNAKDIMPKLDDLPKYENIAYKYTHKTIFLFESYSVALIVNYDDKTYQSEKDKLAEKYTFLEEKVESDYDESKYFIPEYEFSINSYTFKVVAEDANSNTEFPKSFGMIGTSEEKKSIAYLYFYDFDLDYIGQENDRHPMANFVKEYFEYDF
ncbi:hypothetical protein [Clostridium sp. ZS2-4]|uniref:hypothetical protein n=1 Tax=Clostridium sp. ZS2-4 TaxID=2987703 RepID=UPI00227AEFE2|nr:hypothetical protein [Clostridium sp. ZS2-4]MCY6354325.1 hypothetical protein [Clostridium sp. ZS2-4]